MKTLIMTVGLPKSGKSTWARKQGYPIVNPDSIRLALHGNRFIQLAEPFVWAIAKVMVRALFLAGHERVILDATNTTEKRRNDWIGIARTDFHLFDVGNETCIERARALKDDEIIPIIEKMARDLEWPTGEEIERFARAAP